MITPSFFELLRPAVLFWVTVYIGLIVLVNWLFTVVPLVDMGVVKCGRQSLLLLA